jgi:hypothetical protein
MKKPDLTKYAQEVNKMPALPSIPVKISPLTVVAIISHIQLAIRLPGIADSVFAQMAIDAAKQLQELFNKESETYKVLELGWNPEADFLAPSEEPFNRFCEEPCNEFLQNLGCRCTDNRVAELVAGDEQIPPQTLAAGAAMMHQLRQSLESEGFELLDM